MTNFFFCIAWSIPVILGQVVDPFGLFQYGVIGAVLAWFMFRLEKKLDRHTATVNDLVSVISLEILSRDCSNHARISVEKILKNTQERSKSLPVESGFVQ